MLHVYWLNHTVKRFLKNNAILVVYLKCTMYVKQSLYVSHKLSAVRTNSNRYPVNLSFADFNNVIRYCPLVALFLALFHYLLCIQCSMYKLEAK